MSFSVLLSVYKEEKSSNLDSALRSIWDDQTLKPDQIVLVKDGLLPGNLNEIIKKWKKKLNSTFDIVELDKNVGLAKALNKGLENCRFDLVARMDTDDISLPRRFEKQVAFMHENPGVDVASTFIEEVDEQMNPIALRELPVNHTNIFNFAKHRNPISHPAVIFRKQAVISVGGYPEFRKSQDYALWSLMLQEGYEFANLPEVLLKMRTGNEMMERRGLDYFSYEYKIFKYQKNIGFFSYSEFIKNTVSRFILRVSPVSIKRLMYKYLR